MHTFFGGSAKCNQLLVLELEIKFLTISLSIKFPQVISRLKEKIPLHINFSLENTAQDKPGKKN